MPTLREALTALALTCGVPDASARLEAAVAAGLAEAERSPAPPETADAVAGLTTWVLPAAACALAAAGPSAGSDAGTDDTSNVAGVMDAGLRDVAAALMVVRAPSGVSGASSPSDEPPGEGLLLGHALAAGWLSTQLWASGVVGAPGSYAATVAAVTATG